MKGYFGTTHGVADQWLKFLFNRKCEFVTNDEQISNSCSYEDLFYDSDFSSRESHVKEQRNASTGILGLKSGQFPSQRTNIPTVSDA